MNSVDVLLALCKQRKIAVSRVERDLKYGNGYFKSLKKKEIPGNRLSEVADYFGVTMDYLLGATPESYLLGTEYQLKEAEKAYDKETNPDKRDELGGLIDLLRDSVADQRILLSATKKPVADNGNGLVNEDALARQEAIKIIDSYDSESLAQALSYLRYLAASSSPSQKSSQEDA